MATKYDCVACEFSTHSELSLLTHLQVRVATSLCGMPSASPPNQIGHVASRIAVMYSVSKMVCSTYSASGCTRIDIMCCDYILPCPRRSMCVAQTGKHNRVCDDLEKDGWLVCRLCGVRGVVCVMDTHLGGRKHQHREKQCTYCETCGITTTSIKNMLSHMHAAKHKVSAVLRGCCDLPFCGLKASSKLAHAFMPHARQPKK